MRPSRILSHQQLSRGLRTLVGIGVLVALATSPNAAAAPSPSRAVPVLGSPIGPALLDVLGTSAEDVLAPSTRLIGALVALPDGVRADSLGLESVSPGIGRLRASASRISAFSAAHPGLHIEMAPPLHPLMDRVGLSVFATQARALRSADGRGVLLGVADTGLDVTHADFRDASGATRVAWLLDLSLKPGGIHPELEERFGIKDDSGKLIAGRVFSKTDIDGLLRKIDTGACSEAGGRKKCAPTDESGHGTHVTGIAASSGGKSGKDGKDGKYVGIAPAADIVFVRVSRSVLSGIEEDDLVRAVDFMFDRADAERRPMVANLSLGSDFGPHDGTFLWEQAVASHVGPSKPGHVIVAAAGNSGSVTPSPVHQSVRVSKGSRMRVPVKTGGAKSGSVQVWVTLRRGADLRIGLESPEEEWIEPVSQGQQRGKNTTQYKAGVVYGSNHEKSPVPAGSNGAVVVWQGAWPAGTYNITLEGEGMAELYIQASGDAGPGANEPASFVSGVREGTINLPATHPAIIGVGCTVNRSKWESIAGVEVAIKRPALDREGGLPIDLAITPQSPTERELSLIEGEVCWFSSAGPTAAGVPKPEIAAPGALVVSSLSRNAPPGSLGSIFSSPECPPTKSGKPDNRCVQIDEHHGISFGTSMSSPVVAGVAALLLQFDPTLTQDKVLALLQAGAHRYRHSTPFDDQGGPGEVDALGSLDALSQMQNPALHLPSLEQSWIALSSDYVAADGSTPLTAIVELRTADGAHRGDLFDASRLRVSLLVDGEPVASPPAIVRRGPGVWFYVWEPPAGLGGSRATFGATFDGVPIVAPRTLPIAPDRWTARYGSRMFGSSCAMTSMPKSLSTLSYGALVASLIALCAGRRRTGRKGVTPRQR
jgi:subtilisin family serine protease